MRDADMALTDVRGAATVAVYASDGDVMLALSVSLADLPMDITLSPQWLLDGDIAFHVTPCREWFSSFSSGRLGCVRLVDGSTCNIEGAGDICLSLPSGASYMLCHVRYVPRLSQSLISVRQLQVSGCRVLLREQSFQMHCGSLVIARGARSGLVYPMHVSEVRDGVVSCTTLTCHWRETRCVSFASELHYAPETEHAVVQDMSVDSAAAEVEQDCSSESQQVSSNFVQIEVERVCSLEPHVEMTDMEFFDMLMRDEHEVHSDLCTAVQDMPGESTETEVEACIERHCSSETQQGESSGLMTDMLMPEADRRAMPGHRVCSSEDACDTDCAELVDLVRLAEIAHVSSAFGALMYEMLISRPDIAAAVGAFAAGLISRSVIDHGIRHGGVLHVLDTYLQECMSSCRQFAELGVSSVGLPRQRVCLPIEPDALAHRESVGVG